MNVRPLWIFTLPFSLSSSIIFGLDLKSISRSQVSPLFVVFKWKCSTGTWDVASECIELEGPFFPCVASDGEGVFLQRDNFLTSGLQSIDR